MDFINDKQEFDKFIKENKNVVVDFYANWCGPCKMLGAVMEEVLPYGKYKDLVKCIKVDCDVAEELCVEYKIVSIPALFLFKDGQNVDKSIGYLTKDEFTSLLDKNFN